MPPVVGPDVGAMLVIVGAGPNPVYVKPLVSEALCASLLVTVTVTAPAARAAVVAVIVVALTTVTPVAAVPPRLSVAPARKLVPVSVMAVPPLAGPDAGATPVIVGAGGRYAKPGLIEPFCPSVFVTLTLTEPACAQAWSR